MFEEAFPYYWSIGLSPEDYWHGDPWLTVAARRKREIEIEQNNQELWLQGRYIYEGFSAVINAFSWGLDGGKGTKPEGYRDYPIPITKKEKEQEKQRSINKTLEWVQKGQVGGE